MSSATVQWIRYFTIISSIHSHLVALNISLLNENYNAVCGGDSKCNSVSLDRNSDFMLKYGAVCPSCSCKLSCVTNGNCCPEIFFDIQPSCVDTYILHKDLITEYEKSILMIDKCPNAADKELQKLCMHKSNAPEHELSNIPVTSIKNNVTYRNIHCAKCYNETYLTLRSWKLEMECDKFADFNFLSSYAEIINLARKQDCNIYYSSDFDVKLRRCNNIRDVDTELIQTCNVTGTWTSYNKDIEAACLTYDNQHHFFRNVFCFICNPPSQNSPEIAQCNITGKWDIYDPELEIACHSTLSNKVTVPFKNVNCYLCNRNNTEATTGALFSDAKVSYSIKKQSYINFEYDFKIESFDVTYLKRHALRRAGRKNELLLDSSKILKSNANVFENNDNTLNMRNIYQQYFALTGNADFCPNNSLFNLTRSSCSCDDNCWFSGRCCVDKMFERSTSCTNRDFSNHKSRYLIYDSCRDNTDSKFVSLCTSDDDDAIFSLLPVAIQFGYLDNLHFKNVFCLACNYQMDNLSSVFFWKVNISCNRYIPPAYFQTFEDYFNFVKKEGCRFYFSPRVSGLPCADDKFTKCNETGFWDSYDSDIDYACNELHLPSFWYSNKNPFCGICNPPTKVEPIIKSCNVTGLWLNFNRDLELYCLTMPEISHHSPFKNIFCKLCNTQNKEYSIIDNSHHSSVWDQIVEPGIIRRQKMSFRTIFSLSSYIEDKDEKSVEAKCNKTQIFDSIKNDCRDIVCYPGRILTGNSCIPLLPMTSNLGYVLALRLKSELVSKYNNTNMFLEVFRSEFEKFLREHIGIFFLGHELSYLYTSLKCSESEVLAEKTTIEIFIYEKFFISDIIVNRSSIEYNLINILNTKFNFSYENSLNEFTIQPDSKTFHLPQLLFKLAFTQHCFLKMTQEIQSASLYKHSYVTELLACNQIELLDHEFKIDIQTLKLTILLNGMQLENHEYILTSFKRARICIDTFEKVNRLFEHGTTEDYSWGIIIMICAYISLLCLVLTFIAYALFPTLRSLPGKNNMCLVFSMFCAHSFFYFGLNQNENKIGCKIIGILAHYFWLATFGCLNICSFHMFRVFRSKTVLTLQGDRTNKLFVKYAIYSFGTPLIVVTANAVVTVVAEGSFSYGGRMCFLNQFIAVIVTFVLPITLVCVLNTFFFVVTSVKIAKTPKVEMDSTQSKANHVHFVVYLKLFTITGISWIFQILDSFLPKSEFSTIVSLMNSLQGVFIFVSYICNKRVLNLFKSLCKRSGDISGSSSQYKSSVNSTSL